MRDVMGRPFVVFSLPRSRSAWLSVFLTYREWRCGHEELRHLAEIDDARARLHRPNTGSVETAAAPFWRLALHLQPDLRVVTVRRDPEEVTDSAMRAGLGADRATTLAAMQQLDRKLDQIERRTGARSYRFADLTCEDVCADLFEHLLPYEHDRERWATLSRENIQVSVPGLVRYVAAHRPRIDRLNGIARQTSLALLRGAA